MNDMGDNSTFDFSKVDDIHAKRFGIPMEGHPNWNHDGRRIPARSDRLKHKTIEERKRLATLNKKED